ncbi:hypothetical protein AVEN_263224-1 [Araneus ventricosus]|uniref:Uncharacterized protein n=1 Tax=Araneus ventricosus TaxID=182803 RepID=A0A4Y2X9V3_ARAVE|nr:hypothetical protein AVEN_263224-1 [Araneus ventricosus]
MVCRIESAVKPSVLLNIEVFFAVAAEEADSDDAHFMMMKRWSHAYSRVVRGHTLSKIILSEINLSSEQQQFKDAYPNNLHKATPSFSTVEEIRILIDAEKKVKTNVSNEKR